MATKTAINTAAHALMGHRPEIDDSCNFSLTDIGSTCAFLTRVGVNHLAIQNDLVPLGKARSWVAQ